jgi:hypothetical protein
MPYSVKKFGWLPDLPDARDFTYSAPLAMLRKLPAKVDLSGQCPPVYDQGELGSCTGNSIAAAIEFAERKQRRQADHAVAALHLLQRARHRAHGCDGCRRDDP